MKKAVEAGHREARRYLEEQEMEYWEKKSSRDEMVGANIVGGNLLQMIQTGIKKKCPSCAEIIASESEKCEFCEEEFESEEIRRKSEETRNEQQENLPV